ncbi:MAG: SPOR domain-containing protein [Vicinamibacterales bacterium]|nr:SPOR domain-containing protein [Vicinamibacterales bacterium]
MATASDEGFHEIQLNGKQLVFLFMAVTVVSVVIFLCGVLVGRGVASARGVAEPAAAEAAGPDAPQGELAAVAPGPGGAPATANEDLSYYDRLSAGEPVDEPLQEAPPPAGNTPEAAAAPPVPDPPPVAPAPVDTASTTPGEPAGDGFAIQVAALLERTEADALARRLSSRGYPAYVIAPTPGTPRVFRVRVGKFAERREAETVAARLEKEEQFKPWITR